MNETQEGFTIKLNQFEGPFDLLLFFIERDEIDILDIPISKITADFLDYIHKLENLNLDVASEFILVAASLMKIKTKMLLPRPELNDDGTEIDPRQELAFRLLEYKQFKDVLSDFQFLEAQRQLINPRGNTRNELKQIAEKALVDSELESLSLFRLFRCFDNILKELDSRSKKPRHLVYKFEYNIEEQKDYVLQLLTKKSRVSFNEIFGDLKDRLHAIITFLSLLELINTQEIGIVPGLGTNNFWIKKSE